ncbi:hypothetical protein LPJ60_001619 [Coemansia sp. RSA 2675]|nr:hypothetical protein LPJ60_001619 [Coemansia sp. RSA 2675]
MTGAMAPTAASDRRAAVPPTRPVMRQQSENAMRRPTSRIAGRTMSSMAPSMRQPARVPPTRSDSVSGSNYASTGQSNDTRTPRATLGPRPTSNRGNRNPSPAPAPGGSRIPSVPLSPQAGGSYRGRKLVSPSEGREGSRLPRLEANGRWVSGPEQLARELVSLRDANAQLIECANEMHEVINKNKADHDRLCSYTAEVEERVRLLEAELGAERSKGSALEAKIKALEELLAKSTITTDPATERFEGREALQDTMGSVLAACTAMKPRSEFSAAARRDMSRVEAYLAGEHQPLSTPHARDEEMRASRRRSSMLFADLVLPSGGGDYATMGACGPCERCEQLTETTQSLEADNDYYRDANRKLRDAVNDTTSRHNALVRIFEVERARRREIHAANLAEASRAATQERMMFDVEEPLANQFAHSLHIAQPAS